MIRAHCACGARYGFDESSSGKKAKCRKCGSIFAIAPQPIEEPGLSVRADSDFDLSSALEGGGGIGVRDDAPPAPPPDSLRVHAPRDAGALVYDLSAPRGYWENLAWSFLFPTTLNNIILFVVLWMLIAFDRLFLVIAGPFGYVLGLAITGWFCAIRFETIASAAGGEDDLPVFGSGDGFMGDVVLPLLRWIGSWAVVLLPGAVYLAVASISPWRAAELLAGLEGLRSAKDLVEVGFQVTVGLGFFAWPMCALCIAIGGLASLTRFDLMIATIARSLPMYVFTVIIVFAVQLGALLVADALRQAGTGGGIASIWDNLGLQVLLVGVSVYGEIVAARAIGLYYHHFKHKFAWDWG